MANARRVKSQVTGDHATWVDLNDERKAQSIIPWETVDDPGAFASVSGPEMMDPGYITFHEAGLYLVHVTAAVIFGFAGFSTSPVGYADVGVQMQDWDGRIFGASRTVDIAHYPRSNYFDLTAFIEAEVGWSTSVVMWGQLVDGAWTPTYQYAISVSPHPLFAGPCASLDVIKLELGDGGVADPAVAGEIAATSTRKTSHRLGR